MIEPNVVVASNVDDSVTTGAESILNNDEFTDHISDHEGRGVIPPNYDSPSSHIGGVTTSTDDSEEEAPEPNRAGRIKEEYIKEHKVDITGIATTCLDYTCSSSKRGCPFRGACKSVVQDISLVKETRVLLYGPPGAKFSPDVRARYVFNVINNNKVASVDANGMPTVTWRFFVGHREVCQKAFQAITGASYKMIKRAKRRVRDGLNHFQNRVPYGVKAGGSIRNTSKDGGIAMAWLCGMASRLGQYIPNANETRLPFNSKRLVYEYYVAEVRNRGGIVQPVSYSRFLQLWNNDPEACTIKRAKPKGTFAQCNTCADFAAELTRAEDNVTVASVRTRWDLHVDHIQRCRQMYYDKRDFAFARPDQMLCMIMDIMDQSKTTLPHFIRKPKYLANATLLKQCVMGVKVHGHGVFHYNGLPRVSPGGSNFMVECLLRTLRKLADESFDGKLPPKLYLQLDNCGGDNKNFVVVGKRKSKLHCNYCVPQVC